MPRKGTGPRKAGNYVRNISIQPNRENEDDFGRDYNMSAVLPLRGPRRIKRRTAALL
jgi:hypothetical protein